MPVSATAFFPYDAGAGANVTEDQWRKMARLWLPNAPIKNILNGLNPFGDSTGMQVKVDSGAAWNYGAYGEWTAGISTLAVAAAPPPATSRWDRIIVRNDFVNNVMQLDVLTGTAAASPSLPSLTQSSSMWEILLADVGPITNSTTTITAAMVMDRRNFGALSGPGLPRPEKIAEFIVEAAPQGGGAIASVTFSTLPTTYRHLELWWTGRNTAVGNYIENGIRFNGDTTGAYGFERAQATGTLAMSGVEGLSTTSIMGHFMSGDSAPASASGSARIGIPDYRQTTFFKTALSLWGMFATGGTGAFYIDAESGFWNNTAAINSITIFPTSGFFTIGSVFTLYGIP